MSGQRADAPGRKGFGNIGGIIATYSFLAPDAPLYKKGYSICVSFSCLSALCCAIYAVSVTWENRKRDKTARDIGLTDYEKTELGVSTYLFYFAFVVAWILDRGYVCVCVSGFADVVFV